MGGEQSVEARRAHKGARPGGRSARVQAAVIAATIDELLEVGYGDLSTASVAKRAGVAVSTVYRRWETKASLVAEAVAEIAAEAVPPPDTGTLEGDLRHYAISILAQVEDPRIRVLVQSMLTLPERELRRIRMVLWPQRYMAALLVMERARDRGEVPDQADLPRVIETLSAAIWMRVVFIGGHLDEPAIERLVSDMLLVASNPVPLGAPPRD